jgi:hypothetical protein
MKIFYLILILTILSICYSNITFQDLSYNEIKRRSESLKGLYSSYGEAKDIYGILPPQSDEMCSPGILRVSHTTSLSYDYQRPQIFLSGEIHGDERVGPSSSLFVAELLVWSSKCVINKDIESCDKLKSIDLISDEQRNWLTFLATRRDTTIVPAANCQGYIKNKRFDNNIDPNRDFPYSRKDNNCFRSTTAKIISAIMTTSLTQVVVTFHGGMAAIGYEWGSNNHPKPNDLTPDDNSNKDVALKMQKYAGSFHNEKEYPIGPVNTLVYPVDGGMEDWLYASGWDPTTNTICKGYSDKPSFNGATITDGAKNRAMVFLVETADRKKPRDDTLGGPHQPLDNTATSNGHIPRNTRLCLLAIDIAQPYSCVKNVELNLQTKTSINDNSIYNLDVEWEVGGGMKVDATWLSVHKAPINKEELLKKSNDWSYLLDLLPIPDNNPLDKKDINLANVGHNYLTNFPYALSNSMNGKARWGVDNIVGDKFTNTIFKSTSKFTSTKTNRKLNNLRNNNNNNNTRLLIDGNLYNFSPGEYWLVVWTRVDSHWGNIGQGSPSSMGPQSYIANARTNPSWSSSVSDITKGYRNREIKGRNLWPSDPIVIEVSDTGEISISSSVLNCAWWDRANNGESINKNSIEKKNIPITNLSKIVVKTENIVDKNENPLKKILDDQLLKQNKIENSMDNTINLISDKEVENKNNKYDENSKEMNHKSMNVLYKCLGIIIMFSFGYYLLVRINGRTRRVIKNIQPRQVV